VLDFAISCQMSQASKLPDAVDVSDSDTSDEDSARDENGVRIRRQKEDETPVEKEPEGEEWEYAYNELGQLVRRLKKKEGLLFTVFACYLKNNLYFGLVIFRASECH
jgi:hypothetical protein